MKIDFYAGWANSGRLKFKSSGAAALSEEYMNRISHFVPAELKSGLPDRGGETGVKVWCCDRGKRARAYSSEEIAKFLNLARTSAVRQIAVVIGGPDGFTDQAMSRLAPDLLWSFGPLTLPHELAMAVATEQIYRAFTILENLPYHSGH